MPVDTKIDEFVNVSLRIRPAISQDSTESSCLQVISKQPPILLVQDRAQTYHFDNIFQEDVDQETVYNETVKPLVEYVKQGYSCTVFAYGQTGTGKTYTMGTSSWVRSSGDAGLIPRALEQFVECYDDDTETDISVSFVEIYNEKVFDLLQNSKPPLCVKGFRVEGVSQEKIFNCDDAKHLLRMGNRNRHISETKQNSSSSRSHAIFTIYCNVRHINHETSAKLNLVDLAGCESVKKTGNQGSTFQEGVNINKGLLCIGQVMTALSTNASFVPYRQSMITTILQDSLNRKNFVSLIACVNGNPEDCNETVQTLEFAQRVKRMKNKPIVNEAIMRYKKNNPAMFQSVRTSGTPFKRPGTLPQTPCLAKRPRALPLRTVNERTAVDSPKSLASISVSSIVSNVDVTPQTMSPVIKKYMMEMESSLVSRIQTIIKDTLQRPSISSLLAKEKENTPSLSWNQIQNEVSKLVKSEIAQLTVTTVRATSSPIEDRDGLDKIKKVLNYESPTVEESEETSQPDMFEQEPVFKLPELPVTKKKSAEELKRTLSVSPIDFVPRGTAKPPTKRPNCNCNLTTGSSFDSASLNISNTDFNEETIQDKNRDNTINQRMVDFDDFAFKLPEPPVTKKKSVIKGKSTESVIPRWSTRLSMKRKNANDGPVDFDLDVTRIEKNEPTISKIRRSSVRLAKKRNDFEGNTRRETNMNSFENFDGTQNDLSQFSFDGPRYGNRRSSVRLAKKRNNLERKTQKDINTSFNDDRYATRRSSVRLAEKRNDLQESIRKETNNNSFDDFDLEATAEIIKQSTKTNTKTSRLTNTNTKLTIRATPAGKRLQDCKTGFDSPATAHTKHVLRVLNEGSVRELNTLHSVGPKTAQQMVLFRDIKGRLNKISDLSLMPGWSGKKFQKFIELNFIKHQLV